MIVMHYEQWLEQRRANPQDKEVLRVGKLKTIQQAEDKAQHLRHWLGDRVALTVIDNLDDAYTAAEQLCNSGMLALDIETGKTGSHPSSVWPESKIEPYTPDPVFCQYNLLPVRSVQDRQSGMDQTLNICPDRCP